MHIIVVGGGEIGFRLAQALATAHDVFVVDPDPATGERFADADVEFVAGSGAHRTCCGERASSGAGSSSPRRVWTR